MGYELSHDSLAKQIYKKVSSAAQTRRKVEKFANEKYVAHQERNAKLTQDDLDYILPYLKVINITPEVKDFIKKGRDGVIRNRYGRWAILGALIALIGFALFSYKQNKKLENSRAIAENQATIALKQKNLIQAQTNFDTDYTIAAKQLKFHYKKEEDDKNAFEFVLQTYYHLPPLRPFYESIRDFNGTILAIRPDNIDLLEIQKENTKSTRLKVYRAGKNRKNISINTGESNIYRAIFCPKEETIIAFGKRKTNHPKYNKAATNDFLYKWEYGKTRATLNEIMQLPAEQRDAAFSPDGELLFLYYANEKASLLDKNFKPIFDNQSLVNFQKNARQQAVQSSPKNFSLSRLTNVDAALKSMNPTKEQIVDVSYTNNRDLMLARFKEGHIKIWSNQGRTILELHDDDGAIKDAQFLPNGQQFLTLTYDNKVDLWSLQKELLATFSAREPIAEFFICENGNRLLTKHEGGKLKKWDLKQVKIERLAETINYNGIPNTVQFSPDGTAILVACSDATASILQRNKQAKKIVFHHRGAVNSAIYAPDGTKVVTASDDKTMGIWDATSGQLLTKHLINHPKEVTKAFFMPDGKTIFSTSFTHGMLWQLDGTLLLMDNYFGVGEDSKHHYVISDASVSPKGDSLLLVTPWADGTRLWDFSNRDLRIPLNTPQLANYQGPTGKGIFSPDGQKILISNKKDFDLFDSEGKKLFSRFYKKPITAIAFSVTSDLFLVAYGDTMDYRGNTVKLFDLHGNQLMHFRPHKQTITSLAFSPNNDFFATASMDSTVRIWPLKENLLFEKMPKSTELDAFTPFEKIVDFNFDAKDFDEEHDPETLTDVGRLFEAEHKEQAAKAIFNRLATLNDGLAFLTPSEKVTYLGYKVNDFLKTEDVQILIDAARYYKGIDDSKCARKLYQKVVETADGKDKVTPFEKMKFLDFELASFFEERDSNKALENARFFRTNLEKIKIVDSSVDSSTIDQLYQHTEVLYKKKNWKNISIFERERHLHYELADFLENEDPTDLEFILRHFKLKYFKIKSSGKNYKNDVCNIYQRIKFLADNFNKKAPYFSDIDTDFIKVNCEESAQNVTNKSKNSGETKLVSHNE